MVDYPNSTKAKKYYLCLSFEHGYKTPAAKVDEPQGGAAAAKFDVSFAAFPKRGVELTLGTSCSLLRTTRVVLGGL